MLTPTHHTEIVGGSGVSEQIAVLNFWTITDPVEVDKLLNRSNRGGKNSAQLVPGWAVAGVDPTTGKRWLQGVQFKPDSPPTDREGKPQKYLSASGRETQPLFLDTGDAGYWQRVLADPTIPIIITEGAKKSGCLLTLGYAAISLPGVWNGQKQGRLKPLIQQICAVGRQVGMGFDADLMEKRGVRQALDKSGQMLTNAGCVVLVMLGQPVQRH